MKIGIFILILVLACSCANHRHEEINLPLTSLEHISSKGKVTGVSLEMPDSEIGQEKLDSIRSIRAEWVSLIPYGFSLKGEAKVQYGGKWQWWGETEEGCIAIANYAKAAGMKVMLKPHVWVVGQGWPGEFDLETEEEWQEWESTYRDYILKFAHVADSIDADLYCIGTEYRHASVKREVFWRKLIEEVREIYSGELTYAANWDNYQRVKFWDLLDYIGVDAYFPVSKKKEPSLKELRKGWKEVADNLNAFSEKYDKKILFTEYGFKSADYNASPDPPKDQNTRTNFKNQIHSYQVFYESLWGEDFVAGGFLWKWTFRPETLTLESRTDQFSPQGKPVFDLVKQVYGVK